MKLTLAFVGCMAVFAAAVNSAKEYSNKEKFEIFTKKAFCCVPLVGKKGKCYLNRRSWHYLEDTPESVERYLFTRPFDYKLSDNGLWYDSEDKAMAKIAFDTLEDGLTNFIEHLKKSVHYYEGLSKKLDRILKNGDILKFFGVWNYPKMSPIERANTLKNVEKEYPNIIDNDGVITLIALKMFNARIVSKENLRRSVLGRLAR